jgi:hypothetical protein
MSKTPTQMGDDSLAEAFSELVNVVVSMKQAGVALSHVTEPPVFTYLLTPKQFDRVRKICRENQWPQPKCRGILIDLEAVAHPLEARGDKDGCTPADVIAILTNAYCVYSTVHMNKQHAQAILLNTGRKVKVGIGSYYAMAIIEVRNAGGITYLAPVTAYHATEAKIRKIR